jgi:hypothetical protein
MALKFSDKYLKTLGHVLNTGLKNIREIISLDTSNFRVVP